MHYVVVATTKDKNIKVFQMDSEGEWLKDYDDDEGQYPEWVDIRFNQCPGCEHQKQGQHVCGAALAIYHIVNTFSDIKSIEKVGMTTVMSSGHVTMRTETAQEGLAVLFLSALAFSGCYKFQGYAWSWDYYRRVMDDKAMFYVFFSSFLARKFFEREDTDAAIVVSEFISEFEEIHQTLVKLMGRIQQASRKDANLNALVSIISLTNLFKGDMDRYCRHFRKEIRKARQDAQP